MHNRVLRDETFGDHEQGDEDCFGTLCPACECCLHCTGCDCACSDLTCGCFVWNQVHEE